jgi:uncharacterized membrane protein YczE
MTSRLLWTRRIAQLVIGLFLYGVAIALMVRAAVGVAPWDVLTQGVSKHTGIEFGWVTNIIGVAVLLLWIPLRQRPGVGTVANVLMIGPSAQLALWVIPVQHSLWIRIPLFAAGLLLLAVATGLYVGARLGPGPRDGLMTGLVARTGWPVWVVRTGIEVIVTGTGWLLGGNVGFGTLAFALLIGPLVGFTLPRLRVPESRVPESPREEDPAAGSAPPLPTSGTGSVPVL